MNWTRSQKELMDLAREDFKGCRLDVVQICEYGKGLTSALQFMERTSRRASQGPVSVVLDGVSKWDFSRSLAKKTDLSGGICGYFDCIERAVRALAGESHRPVVLWIEEARNMRPAHREAIFAHVAYVAEHIGFDIRVVYLIGRVMYWDGKLQQRVPKFPPLGSRLLHRAKVWEFERAGIKESEEPLELDIARDPQSGTFKPPAKKVASA
ncbi:MAG: hypothetical protein KIS92_01055 [Planctomycetota bacterium]|nr:hypothetical protein [Planctomycetota bacterium]